MVLVSLCDFRMTMTFIVTNLALKEEKNSKKYELRFYEVDEEEKDEGRIKTFRKTDKTLFE